MSWHTGTGVFGIEDCVDHQLSNVVVLESVDHLCAFAASSHQSRHPQFREMLRHRWSGFGDVLGEFVHRTLAIGERPEDLNAGGISQHSEDLDDQRSLVFGQCGAIWLLIRIHAQTIAERDMMPI